MGDISGSIPTPRVQHAAVHLGNHLVLILGGYDSMKKRYMGLADVCVLNVHSLAWMATMTGGVGTRASGVQTQQSATQRTRNAEAEGDNEEDSEDEEDDEENGSNSPDNEASQDIMGLSFLEAADQHAWIRGQFPAPRSSVAIATTSGKHVDRKQIYVFGGSEYVHQVWYSDLFRCTVQSPSREMYEAIE